MKFSKRPYNTRSNTGEYGKLVVLIGFSIKYSYNKIFDTVISGGIKKEYIRWKILAFGYQLPFMGGGER